LTAPTITPAAAPRDGTGNVLEIAGLRTHFFTQDGTIKAVDGVSFEIRYGQTLGVVGESGCGKSITALSTMRLIERPGKTIEGEIRLDGRDLLKLGPDEMGDVRGNAISMIFQEPMTSLNPVFTCGDQIAEAVALHEKLSKSQAWERAISMLEQVGIADAKRRAKAYPHQLSGGMRQRVMIAMALSTNPELLIADEPTTALDVTIQAQILELMKALREQNKMAIMLITHDLGVVAEMADEVVVMYAGKVVERADVDTIFSEPHHPYTQGLLASIPRLGEKRARLEVIRGVVPNPLNLPEGCLFKRRCPYAMPICDTAPPLRAIPSSGEATTRHLSRCWLEPDGSPPAVGPEASPEAATEAAARLTVE
jgi:peptide/nickel transport system ATP-binding protein